MSQDIDILARYRGAINLWVEDELTKEYLEVVWGSTPDVVILTAGGSGGVRAMLEDVRKIGHINVFGLIDGDFQHGNIARWQQPGERFGPIVLPVHEIENYLLDPDALVGCSCHNLNRSAAWIADEIKRRARELTWWKACKEVLASLSDLIRADFPKDPKCHAIMNENQALSHILDYPGAWVSDLPSKLEQFSKASIRDKLIESKRLADEQITDNRGQWKTQFPGREIFRHIRGQIYKPTQDTTKKADPDVDVAKAVARWQFENKTIPPDLTILLDVLRHRVGLSSPPQGSA